MLFGNKKRPPLGGMEMPGPISGFGGGTFGLDGVQITPVQRDSLGSALGVAPETSRPGLGTRLFGEGWADKAYALGGLLRGDTSGVQMLRQEDMLQQQAAAQQAADQRKRALDLADYRTKAGIDAEFKVATPYRWESNDGSLMEIGADGQPRVAYKDPTPKLNWVRADNGDGTFTMVPMGPSGPISGTATGSALPSFSEDDWNNAGGTGGNVGGGFR